MEIGRLVLAPVPKERVLCEIDALAYQYSGIAADVCFEPKVVAQTISAERPVSAGKPDARFCDNGPFLVNATMEVHSAVKNSNFLNRRRALNDDILIDLRNVCFSRKRPFNSGPLC